MTYEYRLDITFSEYFYTWDTYMWLCKTYVQHIYTNDGH